MKQLSQFFEQRGINLGRELVKIEHCIHCGNELKTYRVQLLGGTKKGEWVMVTEECSCILARQTIAAANRVKLNYFKEYSIYNQALSTATLKNYAIQNESQIEALKKAIEFIEKIAEHKPARLMYFGDPGLGKSHLAMGIVKVVETRLQKTCLFLEVPALKNLIKSSWSRESSLTEVEIIKAISEVDLLILDDVGAEGITPWTKELMFTILNSRLSRSLLVTTNMKLADIYQEYGAKIADRLLENMSKRDIVKLEANHSYRLKTFLEEI